MSAPNLAERIENLIASIEEARDAIDVRLVEFDAQGALAALDNADGIAGELLTMIDGR